MSDTTLGVPRRTLYYTEGEESALDAFAVEYGSAPNTTIRLGLRLITGLPVPSWVTKLLQSREQEDRPAA